MSMIIYFNRNKASETVLENLERHGKDINAQCRNGYCGACRCKKLSGSVSYKTEPLAFIKADEILACCAVARGDIVLEV